jgi:NitT/TauT family transport system ATP-binding protein
VSICRALIHDPPLLLMDEPFGSLDALTRDEIALDLAWLCERSRKTVLFITHSISEAVFLSDRVIVMTARPAAIVKDMIVDLPRPRSIEQRGSAEFEHHLHQIRELLFHKRKS